MENIKRIITLNISFTRKKDAGNVPASFSYLPLFDCPD